jgi:hypothetical protein
VNALGAGLNKFRVEVKHTRIGWGHTSGVEVCLTPFKQQVFEGCNIEGRVFDDKWQHRGLIVQVVQYARYSPKKVKMVWDAISPIAEELKGLFIKGEDTKYFDAILKACGNFANYNK